eukprot:CAMPEP_0184374042 /NCGR_PEP_ID=MMETSP1089-20130417/164812_1 /TAXON_ID=38269 ORGANISM="Gloeochaete wittrockiana, Strain SAG46.84" /NCGR_SAMPLE_ID=MMETSP1089 /ASSEMBLY_ACC=CAM_ASM_000445 /LENGTH=544 /DNA_ID=CAMNT_0026717027 /DNA_START=9 /DNA_END=1640 /DNA_ORIENTATION=+
MSDSDEEDIKIPNEPKDRIFFGSIELQLKEEHAAQSSRDGAPRSPTCVSPVPKDAIGPSSPAPRPAVGLSAAVSAGMQAGNINLSSEDAETMPLDEKSAEAKERHAKLLLQLELQKRARSLAVPTNDIQVRQRLRELGQPITFFGEGPAERRDRLRDLLAKAQEEGGEVPAPTAAATLQHDEEEQEEVYELFYTPGSRELRDARMFIAKYSLPRAAARLSARKRLLEDPLAYEAEKMATERSHELVKQFGNVVSQIGDERPLSSCALSPDAAIIATGGFSSVTKLWDIHTCTQKMLLRGHSDRVVSIAFHPDTGQSLPPTAACMATASTDSTVKLWTLQTNTELATLKGHVQRLCAVAFHPSGRYLGTTSFDRTWRLWDVESTQEVLLQEGHSRGTYGIAFQSDGSLVATGGLDAHVFVWDLRTGRQVTVFQGHSKQVLSVDWSPVGYILASGSDDHTVRIWDLRKQQCMCTIPAHFNLVSRVKFQPSLGKFLVSASYDASVKVWSSQDWSLLKVLAGHEGKVMGMDVSADSQTFLTAGYDRTW